MAGTGSTTTATGWSTSPIEWEVETWIGSLVNLPTLPSPISLPGILNHVLHHHPPAGGVAGLPRDAAAIECGGRPDDLEPRYCNFLGTTGVSYVSERSRLPVDPTTGYVDILLNPNGTVVPTTVYSSPSSFGMNSAFYHFWLAERGDLFDPVANPGVPYLLPQVPERRTLQRANTRFLKGERRLLTLFTRTGRSITNQVETFDGNNPSLPFLAPQQGIRGDTR